MHGEQDHIKQVAHQQYMVTVDIIQKLGRYSPCSELFDKVNAMYDTPVRDGMMFQLQGYPSWPQQIDYMPYPTTQDTRRQPMEDYDMDKQYMVYDPSSGMSQLFLGEDLWENKTVRSDGHVMK
jgi:hypothetical protein